MNKEDWSIYKEKGVILFCSTDAILPAWAYILITTYLQPFAKQVVHGNSQEYILLHYQRVLETLDYSIYKDKPVILKGCSKKAVPQSIYTLAIQKLMPVAKSVMFGEACSAVPLYKSK